MTEDAAKDLIPVAAALARVRPLKKEDKYTRCPVKRMVKGIQMVHYWLTSPGSKA